jgi:chaperonin GroES
MEITPLYDRVLIRPIKPDSKTAGGIIIPDTAQEKPIQGEVVAVGEGRITNEGNLIPLKVKVGDKVIFSKNAGYTGVPYHIHVNYDEEFLIVKESEIFGIYKETEVI